MWDAFNWGNNVFSKETKLELHPNKREFVKRPKEKKIMNHAMQQKQKHL